MFKGKYIAVVVPAYNEGLLIQRAVDEVPDYVDNIIVVDDASTDNTVAVVESLNRKGLECLKLPVNQGVGGAIVTGYRRAVQNGAYAVAVMAGDAQMDGGDLSSLLLPVVTDQADYAKGDRLAFKGVFKEMPLLRFLGNHVLSLLTKITSGYTNVRDSQCGYTAVGAKILRKIELENVYTRYGFPNDMLAFLHSAGGRLAQVPVRPIYADEVSGISLFTAFFRVPMVLLRSFWERKKRETKKRAALVEPIQRP